MRVQEWLDATGADHFYSGNDGPIGWIPWRHLDASSPRNGTREGMALLPEGSILDQISEHLHIFSVLELRAQLREPRLIAINTFVPSTVFTKCAVKRCLAWQRKQRRRLWRLQVHSDRSLLSSRSSMNTLTRGEGQMKTASCPTTRTM